MCLITYSPKGAKSLNWGFLDHSAFRMNDDGFGVAWFEAATGCWHEMKSLRAKVLRRVVRRIPENAPLIIHQRYATHGTVTLENCHPFNVAGALLFHNGTISGTRADSRSAIRVGDNKYKYQASEISDTRAYCEDELEPILEAGGVDLLLEDSVQWSVSNRIGWGSVLTIAIPGVAEPVIVNETRGEWIEGVYYSNTYSLPSKVEKYGGMYGSEWASDDEWDQWLKQGEEEKAAKFRAESEAIEAQEREGTGTGKALICLPGFADSQISEEDARACGLIDADFDAVEPNDVCACDSGMPDYEPENYPGADADAEEWEEWLEAERNRYQRLKESA